MSPRKMSKGQLETVRKENTIPLDFFFPQCLIIFTVKIL